MFHPTLLFIFDSPTQIIFVVIIIVLLFGAGRLPQLAKSLGQSRKAFREGMREAEEDEAAEKAQLTAKPQAPGIAEMTDEELMAEMRRRVESKQS
ncbi:MAG TPA: twin-arginine translocase TatA/TatE family subunit [Pyrinomonadaceae bacterium]|jgi:sec-independent protein translocase protein TatA|nr:twin-arginine translocase TatA/TatE family subunit [Pyrinomonadaceae bacterium]